MNQTTTYGSGGLWEPYQIAGTPEEDVNRWGKIAFDHFLDIHHSKDCGLAGVQLMNFYQLFKEGEFNQTPSWHDIVLNFQQLSSIELRKMKLPECYTSAYSFSTIVIEQKYYMSWMMKKLDALGVTFEQRKVAALEEIVGYDVIINCTGLGAAQLLGDELMYPIRGQVLRIKAPWVKNVWMFGNNYLIPNVDSIVVGGTQQKGNWSTTSSIDDTEQIMRNVCALFPSLHDAPVESIWTGLRPGRTPLRLDSDLYTFSNGSIMPVIHCYGHGGSGITLAMGCAHDVVFKHLLPFLRNT